MLQQLLRWDQPGDFFRNTSVKGDLQPFGSERIHATDEGLTGHRACSGECILNLSPRDGEQYTFAKPTTSRGVPIAHESLSPAEDFPACPCSSVADHHVMAVLCPKTSQACPHFPRTNNSDIHITILSEMPGAAVQLCTARNGVD